MVLMRAVPQMAYRADSEDDTEVRQSGLQAFEQRLPYGDNLFDRESLADETCSGFVMTVGNECAAVCKAIDPGGAEGKAEYVGTAKPLRSGAEGAVDFAKRFICCRAG